MRKATHYTCGARFAMQNTGLIVMLNFEPTVDEKVDWLTHTF
jgi:hypothetical protein